MAPCWPKRVSCTIVINMSKFQWRLNHPSHYLNLYGILQPVIDSFFSKTPLLNLISGMIFRVLIGLLGLNSILFLCTQIYCNSSDDLVFLNLISGTACMLIWTGHPILVLLKQNTLFVCKPSIVVKWIILWTFLGQDTSKTRRLPHPIMPHGNDIF